MSDPSLPVVDVTDAARRPFARVDLLPGIRAKLVLAEILADAEHGRGNPVSVELRAISAELRDEAEAQAIIAKANNPQVHPRGYEGLEWPTFRSQAKAAFRRLRGQK